MPEWLSDSFVDVDVSGWDTAVRLVMAWVLGAVVALVYRISVGRRGLDGKARPTAMNTTLVLLTILICLVTLVIGNSVARAFSLVGALSIVRFRTVVEDTRDTAFVIFAVAVGMSVGAGHLLAPVLAIPITAAAALMFRPCDPSNAGDQGLTEAELTVRVSVGYDPTNLLSEPFDSHLERRRLTSMSTVRQGSAYSLTYQVRLLPGESAVALVAQLNRVEGVQEVEIRQS